MDIVFYNGDFLSKSEVSISINNRSFNYGDGFFESIKIVNSKPFNLKHHFNRISNALNILSIDNSISLEFVKKNIDRLIELNNITHGSAKIHFSRQSIGKYLPKSNNFDLFISSSKGYDYIHNNALSLCFYEDEYKSKGSLSNVKSTSALVYVLASIYAYENRCDNAILLTIEGKISEIANANIFIVRNNKIYTPPLVDACVDGTMRRWIMNKENIIEKSIFKNEILDSDEVFVTNATYGFTAVKSIDNHSFNSYKVSSAFQQDLISSCLDL